MEKTFKIEIEELLQRVVKVKAKSLSEAIDKVEENIEMKSIFWIMKTSKV